MPLAQQHQHNHRLFFYHLALGDALCVPYVFGFSIYEYFVTCVYAIHVILILVHRETKKMILT